MGNRIKSEQTKEKYKLSLQEKWELNTRHFLLTMNEDILGLSVGGGRFANENSLNLLHIRSQARESQWYFSVWAGKLPVEIKEALKEELQLGITRFYGDWLETKKVVLEEKSGA